MSGSSGVHWLRQILNCRVLLFLGYHQSIQTYEYVDPSNLAIAAKRLLLQIDIAMRPNNQQRFVL